MDEKTKRGEQGNVDRHDREEQTYRRIAKIEQEKYRRPSRRLSGQENRTLLIYQRDALVERHAKFNSKHVGNK